MHRDADAMLTTEVRADSFAVWALATIRRQPARSLRYAALDAIMSAWDDAELRDAEAPR